MKFARVDGLKLMSLLDFTYSTAFKPRSICHFWTDCCTIRHTESQVAEEEMEFHLRGTPAKSDVDLCFFDCLAGVLGRLGKRSVANGGGAYKKSGT